MLNKLNRLRKDKEIKTVFVKGRFVSIKSVLVNILPNGRGYSRFTVIISKKVIKKATARNLVRRRITEIIRLRLVKIKPGFDCVLNVKENLVSVKYLELEQIIYNLFSKADLLC